MFKNALQMGLILSLLSGCGPGLQNILQNPSQTNNPNSGSGDSNSKNVLLSDPENEFLTRINGLRAQYNLPLLQISYALQVSARSHSEYMNSNDLLSHSEPSPNASSYDRIQNAGGDFGATAENIACGNASAESTYNQWFHSTGHLANMLSVNYQFIGIARAGTDAEKNSKNCPYYWTTDFGGD